MVIEMDTMKMFPVLGLVVNNHTKGLLGIISNINNINFPVEFDELYFVAAYLYASQSIKHGPVALVEAYVLRFSASLCSSHSKLGLQSAFESDHRRLR